MWNDVFLSFRGVGIRKTFISHLFSSLKKKDITAFTASEPSSFDLQAIKNSEVAITVISKDYESLDWWVDEVAKMIDCEKVGTLRTVPVLYQVDPSYVLKWLGHTETYTQMDKTQREKLDTVKKWLDAHIKNKSCFNSHDWVDDSELVDKITRFVFDFLKSSTSSNENRGVIPPLNLKLEDSGLSSNPLSNMLKLNLSSSFWISKLPGIRSPHFETTFDPSSYLAYRKLKLRKLVLDPKSTVVGICGLEGVGKTNLAKQVSEEISPQFQHSFIMSNFSNKMHQQDSTYRSNSLLNFACESLKGSSFHGSSDDSIKEMIGYRKVFLVVDDVDDIKDLKFVIKEASRFGPGSRVIVITQELALLAQSGVKQIYEVECPKYEEALAFFSELAFKQSNPLLGFEALSFRAVQVSNRLPLALKMLGSFLRDKEKSEWVSTLRRLEASHNKYATEVCRRIGADDYAPRRPIKVDQHIGVDEANRFPFYRFALK